MAIQEHCSSMGGKTICVREGMVGLIIVDQKDFSKLSEVCAHRYIMSEHTKDLFVYINYEIRL